MKHFFSHIGYSALRPRHQWLYEKSKEKSTPDTPGEDEKKPEPPSTTPLDTNQEIQNALVTARPAPPTNTPSEGHTKTPPQQKITPQQRQEQFGMTLTRLSREHPDITAKYAEYEKKQTEFRAESERYKNTNSFWNGLFGNAEDRLEASRVALDKSRLDVMNLSDNDEKISAEDKKAMRYGLMMEDPAIYRQNADSAGRLSEAYGEHAQQARFVRNTAGGAALGVAAVMTGGAALGVAGGTLSTAGGVTLSTSVGTVAGVSAAGGMGATSYELLRGSGEIVGTSAITGESLAQTTEKLAPKIEARAVESGEIGMKIGAVLGSGGVLAPQTTLWGGAGLAAWGGSQALDSAVQNQNRANTLTEQANNAAAQGDEKQAALLRQEASLAQLQAGLSGLDVGTTFVSGGAILSKMGASTGVWNTPRVTIDMGDGRHVEPVNISELRSNNNTDIFANNSVHPSPEISPIKSEGEIPKRTEEIKPHREQAEKPGVTPYPELSASQIDALMPTPIKRNTVLRDIADVPRDTAVHHMGDTNGSYEGFVTNLRTGEKPLIDAEGNWIGGDKPLVLAGDILGDRNMGGIQTYEHIARLREQGANIHTLAGNHDDFVIGHLTDGEHIGIPTDVIASINGQGKGLLEFGQFADPEARNFFNLPDGENILQAMRADPRGKKVLEEMTNMKLAEQIDDTLYVHTDPNADMISSILRNPEGVDGVNATFQKNLRARFLDGADPSTLDRDFYDLRKTFLSTDNGRKGDRRTGEDIKPMEEQDGILLRSLGINRIVHGHTDHVRQGQPRTIVIGGLEVTSIDNSSFKKGTDNGTRSTGYIDTNGDHILSHK